MSPPPFEEWLPGSFAPITTWGVQETIVHLENNRYNPSLEMALKIAQVFNKQVEELFRLK